MSKSLGNNLDHLSGVDHPRSSHQGDKTNDLQVRRASRSTMGGMVSALAAALCGPAKHIDVEKACLVKPTDCNGYTHLNHQELLLKHSRNRAPQIQPRHIPRHSSTGYTTDESDSEYCDIQEPLAYTANDSPRSNKYPDLPYIDEDSDISMVSASEFNLSLEIPAPNNDKPPAPNNDKPPAPNNDKPPAPNNDKLPATNSQQTTASGTEVIVVSDLEYSADEDQGEEEEDGSSEDEMERIDEESTGEVEEHFCDSDCEHSEEEVDDESEAASDEEEHECTSECEHSDIEYQELSDAEYESEVENDISEAESEQCLSENGEEVIEISEDEVSCDEEQQTDSEEEIQACQCDSDCPPYCDGNHHECSSECGCDNEQSVSEDESEPEVVAADNQSHHNGNSQICHMQETNSKSTSNSMTDSSTDLGILQEITSQHLKPIERNNNRLQRNNSHRHFVRSSTTNDVMGELRTAIDARVRRSASCRETTIDYRQKYAHLSRDNPSIEEDFGKLDVKDREERRKQRRTRLRTLELKREQCLDELRDGTEENITNRVYRDMVNVETA